MKAGLFEDFDFGTLDSSLFSSTSNDYVKNNLTKPIENTFNQNDTSETFKLFNECELCSELLFNESKISDYFDQNDKPSKSVKPILSNINLNNLSDLELQDYINANFKDSLLSFSDTCDKIPDLYFRWLQPPPERVHATSPSKLLTSKKSGGIFSLSVQIVAHCNDESFVPYSFSQDISLIIEICGRHKVKNASGKIKPVNTNNLVVLDKNPIGKPLLITDTLDSENGIIITLPKGQSIFSFKNLSLTCGSNAARSKNAPNSARGWDWDYFLRIKVALSSDIYIKPLISNQITTDSNRSQTREKRKRTLENAILPPAKRQATSSNCTIAPYFGLFQPIPLTMDNTNLNTASPFDFTSLPILSSNPKLSI